MQQKNYLKMQLNPTPVLFTNNPRGYWIGKNQLQGITGMLSRQLFPNKYNAVPEKILKKAAERGSRIHSDIEMFDMFGVANSEESEWYKTLKEKEQFEVVRSEYLVTDGEHFASAIDKVLILNGDLCIADVKSTYEIDLKYVSWQSSIYKYLFELQNPHLEIKRLFAIWVRKGAFLKEVEIIPKEVIKELLNAEINGVQFINPYEKEVSTINSTEAKNLVKNITEIAIEIKRLEALKGEYNKRIEGLLTNLGVTKWETDYFTITKTNPYTKEGFDSKSFESEHPDLYKKYIKKTDVKGSIKTTIKKN